MANFLPISFIDTFDLAASLKTKLHLFPTADTYGRRIFDLRWKNPDAVLWKAHASTRNWVELNNVLNIISRIGGNTIQGKLERGRVSLEMLEPGSMVPWEERSDNYSRAYLPIRTNPATRLFVGLESAYLLPGQLTVVARAPTAALNLGEWATITLVVDFRQVAERNVTP